MASLGSFLLMATLVVSAYAIASSIAGARRGSRSLVESGVGAFYLASALMTVASAVIVHAFVTNDYSIKYVQHYSDIAQPLFYKITSYWGGLDGSIMFWVFLLAVFGSLAIYVNRDRHRELIPYVVAIISAVQVFFLFMMIVHKNPFETFLVQAPADGRGLNPLLQNIYMVVHPPQPLHRLRGDDHPVRLRHGGAHHRPPGRFLAARGPPVDDGELAVPEPRPHARHDLGVRGTGLGRLLGLGPGRERRLLPWFTASAFLHSVIVQERRGMLKVWNVSLVIITFFLTIFGTFMTRSGIVQSVHAFGEDRTLTWMFTVFMVAILLFSFAWVIRRLPLLKPRYDLDSWVSREAAFVANNWILLIAAMLVLFGTMFPTLSEALTGNRLTVGPPFFNRWMTPIGLVLLLLTGVAPLLAWRRSTLANLRDSFLWPVVFMAAVTARLRRPRRARLVVGHLLRAVRVRGRHDHPGIRARGAACGRRRRAPTLFTARRRARDARAPALRRLHRPPGHRADVSSASPARASRPISRCC